MYANVHPLQVRRLGQRLARLDRNHGQRAFLVHRDDGRIVQPLGAAHHQGREVAKPERRIAVGDQAQRVRGARTLAHRRQIDALLGKIALFLAYEEHGVIGPHDPVQLHRDRVRRKRGAHAAQPQARQHAGRHP
ncbi:hypothetical protein D3C86_1245280 [compost metagenome]